MSSIKIIIIIIIIKLHGLINLKMKVVCSFEVSWSHYPTTRRNNPEDVLPQHEHKFAIDQILRWRHFQLVEL